MQVEEKLKEIEREIRSLKALLISKGERSEGELVSLRGMAKPLVSEKRLDESIEKAKKSLFSRDRHALRS